MKKLLKIFVVILAIVFLVLGCALAYVQYALPNVDAAPNLAIKADAELLRRGDYLVNRVMACLVCHSRRDWTKFSAPIVPGTEGEGGEDFDRAAGFPGNFTPPNLTPAHLANWTDGEVFRALTAGVRKNGEPLFPVMPYQMYGQLDESDLQAVVAYLRTLAPKDHAVPNAEADFPFSLILRTIPKQPTLGKRPTDTVKYGEYLTKAASCFDCHTKLENGSRSAEWAFAGGFDFRLPDGSTVRSANITPDQETGIGNLSKENFIRRFKAYETSVYQPAPVKTGEFNTVMPWTVFAGMTEQDLGAIYDYLRTVRPIRQSITKFSPPTQTAASK